MSRRPNVPGFARVGVGALATAFFVRFFTAGPFPNPETITLAILRGASSSGRRPSHCDLTWNGPTLSVSPLKGIGYRGSPQTSRGHPKYRPADIEPATWPDIRGRGTCLVCASFGSTDLQNADSARCCKFRNSQQQRASDLDPTNAWIPKLDVAGLGCGTCRLTGGQPAILHTPMESGFRQRRYALTVCRANGVERRSLCSSECWMNLGSAHATVYTNLVGPTQGPTKRSGSQVRRLMQRLGG